MDTLIKTGNESIEAAICSRRILYAEFVVRMEDTRLLKYVLFEELEECAGCAGGAGKMIVDEVFSG